MGVFETFTKRRKKAEKSGQEDVYVYDDVPHPLRVQIIHIWWDTLGPFYNNQGNHARNAGLWSMIYKTLTRELGVLELGKGRHDLYENCTAHFLETDTDGALDMIDLTFKVISRLEKYKYMSRGADDDPVTELNHRFREHTIGYTFENDQLRRIDSQYLHAEVVRPAIALLSEEKFIGAAEEFLKAHEHYRKGETKQAITEALKAFESTMKAICEEREWIYGNKATAKPLLDTLFEKGLIPSQLQTHMSGLRATLEAGVPTIGNTMGRHGQGKESVQTPEHIAAFALHLTASNIVMLVNAHKSLK